MKFFRRTFFMILLGTAVLVSTPVREAKAIAILEIIRQAVKWVIKAVDLMIQRLQNETIALQNAAKVLENKLSQLKLTEIAQWTDKQRQLYKGYFDELWKVRNTLAAYKRIHQIVARQVKIVEEYKFTWHMLSQDKHFTKAEIDYMYRVYTGIINESLYNIEQLYLVVNAYKMQMTDARRLEIINKAGDNIDQNYADLKQFNNQNIGLSIQRSKDEAEIQSVRKLYGLPN